MEGALVNGGMGPEETELGVEAPDEAGVDEGVFRRDDFAMAGVFLTDRRLDMLFGRFVEPVYLVCLFSLGPGCTADWRGFYLACYLKLIDDRGK